MTTARIAMALALAACGAAAACSGGDDHPPTGNADYDGGGSGSASGSTSGSGSGGSTGSGSGSGDDGGTPGDGAPQDVFVSQPSDSSMAEATCSPNRTYGAAVTVDGLPTFASQPLVTLTSDELTAAWVLDAGGGEGQVYVADRTSTSAPFGTAHLVPGATVGGSTGFVDGGAITDGGDSYFAFDRVAISSDGLTLTGVAVGGLHMAQVLRADRASPFASVPSEVPYATLASTLMPGEKLGDPVVSSDGLDLVYSKYGKSPTLTVYETFRSSAAMNWPSGAGNMMGAVAEASGQRKRPTSMTADRLTLFVWDEAGQAYGVLRSSTTAPFNFAIPFGAKFSLQVSADCSRLYYVQPASPSGYALVRADSN
jgi:hypothetical protein